MNKTLIYALMIIFSGVLMAGCLGKTEVVDDSSAVNENVEESENTNNDVVDIEEDTEDTTNNIEEVENDGVEVGEGVQTYTIADVQAHATPEDCWMVIDGSVYEVTEYISSHPGGAAIIQGCGKEATELFNTKGGADSAGHSGQADNSLVDYKIGELES